MGNKKLEGTPRPQVGKPSRRSKPSTSPQLSPWLGHIPTPRSQDWADRLVAPASAHSAGTIQWKTLGFFEDRDCCWWIGFVTSILILVACILVLVSALFATCTVEHSPESSEDSSEWLASLGEIPRASQEQQ